LKYYVIQPIFDIDPNSFYSTLVIIGICYLVFYLYKITVPQPDEIIAVPNEIINLKECLKQSNENESKYGAINNSFEVDQNDFKNPLIR
jgi:hypothetical protein